MSFQIVADSATDLPVDILTKYNIYIVPTTIIFGTQQYLDGEISREDLIARLENGEFATTSQPSPESFRQVYRKVVEEHENPEILGIHLTSKLSGTMSGAHANKMEFPDANIRLVDTENVSFGAGYFILVACLLREEGYDMEEVAQKLEKVRNYVNLRAIIDDVNYLKRGGRVSVSKFLLLKLLKLKPIVKNSEGLIVTMGVTFGKRKGLDKIISSITEVENVGSNPMLFLGHANTPEDIDYLYKKLDNAIQFDKDRYMVVNITATLICQTGPRVCGALLAPNLDFVKAL